MDVAAAKLYTGHVELVVVPHRTCIGAHRISKLLRRKRKAALGCTAQRIKAFPSCMPACNSTSSAHQIDLSRGQTLNQELDGASGASRTSSIGSNHLWCMC